MPREEKPVRLRPVDDEAAPAPVVRLSNRETEASGRDNKPVQLKLHKGEELPNQVSRRLDVPSREELELRTHQPGIEALIETDSFNPDALEQQWGEEAVNRNPIPWGWFVLLGLLLAAALIWSLTRVKEGETQVEQVRVTTESALVDEQQEIEEATLLIERIEGALRRYFAGSTVESLARQVRHPQRVVPLMRAHYPSSGVATVPLRSIRMLQPLTLDNRGNFWMASVILADGSTHNLVLEIDPTGRPLIDWETLVCHQPMPWDEYVRQRPTGTSMDFRVYLERDNFHSHEFADSNRWASFRLTALDSEETLFGYVAVDSDELPKLLALLDADPGRRVSVILRLLIPEGLSSRRGVVIEKLLSPRWIYLESPDGGP